jgi:hypothetical protein
MLHGLVSDDEYKVSNDPNLLGWNPTMSTQLIIVQLETSYSKSMANIIQNSNVLFTSDFNPWDAPDMLFHRVEQCQEVAILGAMPYMAAQLVNNMMHLLLKSGIFPMREFKQWGLVQNKLFVASATIAATHVITDTGATSNFIMVESTLSTRG